MEITMKQWQLNIKSQQETESLARKLSELAWGGMVIALDGDLGAGKTTFSKSFATQLGVQGIVSSPTFTIIKEYEGSELPFYHMDVYRLSIEEADELGLDDYFYGQGVTIIEWASLITEIMPPQYVSLFIEYVDEEERLVTLKAYGERYISCIEKLIDGSTSQ